MRNALTPLPVDALIPQILEILQREKNLVIEAPPGTGKTTRIPLALLRLGMGQVWVLEPRRLAARLASRHVAELAGEPLGQSVGYQVRWEQVGGPQTSLWFLTEGILLRRLLVDPHLSRAGVVVLDEFHERHLETDLAIALLRRLQQTVRPQLRLVVMSATLDGESVAQYLGGCPLLRSQLRLYEAQISYRPESPAPVEERVREAVGELLEGPGKGDVLVFLPGAREIRRAARALEPLAARRGLLIAPLHGDLTAEEQDRAVGPADRRKVILSTNIAESAITIDGVTAVVDSGLERVPQHSPWNGLPVLRLARISQSSAIQRAGRACRTAPGRVIRLYPEEDFRRRPLRAVPEIRRLDLSETALLLRALSIGVQDLDWLEPPEPAAVQAAEALLLRLGAVDGSGRLTETGRAMAELPLAVRLARLVVEAKARGVGEDGALAAALLSLEARLPSQVQHHTDSDVFVLLEANRNHPQARRLAAAISRTLGVGTRQGSDEEALRRCLLVAFADRIARRRQGDELLLAGGDSALLSRSSTVREAEFLVALDVEERPERGLPLVRLASAIDPAWLLDLFPEQVEESSRVEWNRQGERAEMVNRLIYDRLVIHESRNSQAGAGPLSELLREKALEAGLGRFLDLEQLRSFLARVAFAAQHGGFPTLTEDAAFEELAQLCQGRTSFADLEAALAEQSMIRRLEAKLPEHIRRQIEQLAPERLRLPSGRTARIQYMYGQAPRVAARLQEFFGMKETPSIAAGKVPLVLELLAPNQRPVQTTTDLAGFWQRWYPRIRKELMRRYPKHSWPESPG